MKTQATKDILVDLSIKHNLPIDAIYDIVISQFEHLASEIAKGEQYNHIRLWKFGFFKSNVKIYKTKEDADITEREDECEE
jgi:hypothetical protein